MLTNSGRMVLKVLLLALILATGAFVGIACASGATAPGEQEKTWGAFAPTEPDDSSTELLMVSQGLTVQLSKESVAKGDSFIISGVAAANSSLNLLIIGPKGSGGTLIDGSGKGIYNTIVTANADGTFSREIYVGFVVDARSYAVVVLIPGCDGHYNGLPPGTSVNNFMEELEKKYSLNLSAKTQEQLIAIIEDATVYAVGSDDLMWLGSVNVYASGAEWHVYLGQSIQTAINSAGIGDTIYVHSGTYVENVNVNKRLVLIGVGKPVIDAGALGSAIYLNADGITLDGFTTTNPRHTLGDGGIQVNSNNNTIRNNSAFYNNFCVALDYSNNNTITGNDASNSDAWGIVLSYSSNNLITDNQVNNNIWPGIYLVSSHNNTISGNAMVNNNLQGIYLFDSSNNTITENDLITNRFGVFLEYLSINNKVYFNNFMDNSEDQAVDNPGANSWDNGYPAGGNYWSDYTGLDEFSGVNQDETGSDGIGDTPYGIPPAGAKDHYPLMQPWGELSLKWHKTFGGMNSEVGCSVQQTSDGGFIVTGYTASFGAGSKDVYLLKTDANGTEEWHKTFGGINSDEGMSVQQTSDGGYIITGITYSFGAGTRDVYLIKTDENGIEEWHRTFGGTNYDEGWAVQQTSDGGYIIAGRTNSLGGYYDVYLIKTDENGIEEWHRTYGGGSDDRAYSIQKTSDGGYIITGYAYYSGAGPVAVYLIKTDENGIEEWHRIFGGPGYDYGNSVQQTFDGGYIIAGQTSSFGAGSSDVYLIKTDENGIEEWHRTFGGSSDDAGNEVQQTSDGGYIVTGYTASFGAGSSDVYLIKTDENGIEEWHRTFGGASDDAGNEVQQTTDGGYIIAGYTGSFGAGSADVWLIRLAPQGNQPPTAIIDSITPDPAKQGRDIISFIGHGNDSDGSVVAYNWSSSIDGFLNTSPSFTIPASELSAGTHIIYFCVQDDYGAWSSAATEILTINPPNQPPVASFIYLPVNPGINETITFNALSSFDADGSIISYNWSFGDGNVTNTTELIITHSYSSVGNYTVNLTVTDDEGATNMTSQELQVSLKPPIAMFSCSPPNPVVNETVTFNASGSYDPNGVITTYHFEFGDGTNGTGEVVTHAYSSVGTYTVNLTLTDNEGATNRTSQLLKVFSNVSCFDTEPGTYPSISGTHNGTITMTHTVTVSTIYLYPCAGTGGHIKYARIWNSSWDGVEAQWIGYVGDWHNLSFDKNFTLAAGETYNYTIQTGSYPQIHHVPELLTAKGWITCTSFVDVNGERSSNWIPAIKLMEPEERPSPTWSITWMRDLQMTATGADSIYPTLGLNGSTVHLAWVDQRDGGGNSEIYYNRSTDEGITWQAADTRISNDPASSIKANFAVNGEIVHLFWRDDRDGNYEEYVIQSTDGGVSWGPENRLTNDTGYSGCPFPAINGDLINLFWRDNRSGTFKIYQKRSVDAGVNWGSDILLTPDGIMAEFPFPATAGATIHLVWRDRRDGNAEIYYKRSLDGGLNWTDDFRLTNDTNESEHPKIVAQGETLHVVWRDNRDGNYEVYYKRSTDGGKSWSSDVRLTNNPGQSLWPALAATSHLLHLLWCDERNGTQALYYTVSTDQGTTWAEETRLSECVAPLNMMGAQPIAVTDTCIHIVFNDNRTGTNEIYYKRGAISGSL